MRKLTTPALFLSLAMTSATYSTSSWGWGNLVEDVKKTGGQVLLQPLSQSNGSTTSLNTDTLINGLREALVVGSERAIKLVSTDGGYLNDPKIRVPMPKVLDKLADPLRQFGMGKYVDQFESSINRAAERAAPHATDIMVDSIKNMSFEDAQKIYNGPDDSATQYLRETAGPKISALFKPEIDSALGEVNATRYYKELAVKAADLPVIGKEVNTDLTDHVTNAALDGLFLKLAAEEKAIRTNPAARTTDLLKQLWD